MGDSIQRGRLDEPGAAPAAGEFARALLEHDGVRVEQILSGGLEGPVEYLQDDDEWVVLLGGRATLLVDGQSVELSAGEWLFLPAGTPHTLVRTAPGSSWLAVHVAPGR